MGENTGLVGPKTLVTHRPQIDTWLRESGVLPQGEVTGVEVTGRRSTDLSVTAPVRLSYSPDATEGVPDSVFFKAAGIESRVSNAEVQFYRLVGPRLDDGPLVTCYASQYSSQRGAYCLVLEDVSKSHILPQRLDQVDWFRSEYSWDVAAQIVQGLALVHSLFWGDLQLAVGLSLRTISYPRRGTSWTPSRDMMMLLIDSFLRSGIVSHLRPVNSCARSARPIPSSFWTGSSQGPISP